LSLSPWTSFMKRIRKVTDVPLIMVSEILWPRMSSSIFCASPLLHHAWAQATFPPQERARMPCVGSANHHTSFLTGAYSKWATQVTPPRRFTHEGCSTQSYMVAKHKEWHQRDCTHLQGVFQNQKGTASCTTVSMVVAYSFLTVHICRLCYLSAQSLPHYDGCSLQVARSNWPREDRHRRGDS